MCNTQGFPLFNVVQANSVLTSIPQETAYFIAEMSYYDSDFFDAYVRICSIWYWRTGLLQIGRSGFG